MTATEELRKMLDERGVEYEVDDAKTVKVTRWGAYGDWVSFIEYDNGDTKFCIDARRLTPEQAVEATLGRGTCHPVPIYGFDGEFTEYDYDECSACGTEWDGDTPNFCPWCGRKVVDG